VVAETEEKPTITHLVSLSVGTVGGEDHHQTFQDLSELAANLEPLHPYVSVSSTLTNEVEDVLSEDLHHDEGTIRKVKLSILAAVPNLTSEQLFDIVRECQNAGILFRERA
jgi:hypothetical protein